MRINVMSYIYFLYTHGRGGRLRGVRVLLLGAVVGGCRVLGAGGICGGQQFNYISKHFVYEV
jgi:hypothetical protein